MKTLDDFIKSEKEEHIKSGINTKGARISYDDFLIFKKASKEYTDYMCQEQRKLCAEHSRLHFHDGFNKTGEQLKYFQSGADYLTVDKDSILNAPLATDKNK